MWMYNMTKFNLLDWLLLIAYLAQPLVWALLDLQESTPHSLTRTHWQAQYIYIHTRGCSTACGRAALLSTVATHFTWCTWNVSHEKHLRTMNTCTIFRDPPRERERERILAKYFPPTTATRSLSLTRKFASSVGSAEALQASLTATRHAWRSLLSLVRGGAVGETVIMNKSGWSWKSLDLCACAYLDPVSVCVKLGVLDMAAAEAARGGLDREPASSPVSSTSRDEPSTTDELRRLRLAHEGMRLLLSSEVKQAERLFRKSRWVDLCGVWTKPSAR